MLLHLLMIRNACVYFFEALVQTCVISHSLRKIRSLYISISLQVYHNLNMGSTLWLLSLSFLSLSLRCQTRYSNPSFSCFVLEFMDNSFPGYYFACTQPNHTRFHKLSKPFGTQKKFQCRHQFWRWKAGS